MDRRELAKLDIFDIQDRIPDLAITCDPIFYVQRIPTQVPMEIYATPVSYKAFMTEVGAAGLEADLESGRCFGAFWRYEVKLNIPEQWQPKRSYHAQKEG